MTDAVHPEAMSPGQTQGFLRASFDVHSSARSAPQAQQLVERVLRRSMDVSMLRGYKAHAVPPADGASKSLSSSLSTPASFDLQYFSAHDAQTPVRGRRSYEAAFAGVTPPNRARALMSPTESFLYGERAARIGGKSSVSSWRLKSGAGQTYGGDAGVWG